MGERCKLRFAFRLFDPIGILHSHSGQAKASNTNSVGPFLNSR